MSTFTDWNGPQGGRGPTLAMWQELIDQYKELLGKDYVEAIDGKGLSTNDFTDALKNKLDAINATAANKQLGGIVQNSDNLVTAGTIYTALQNYVTKVNGKELSTNDFTTAYKNSLDNLGGAASRDVTTAIEQNGTKLVTAGAVYSALQDYVKKSNGNQGLSTNDFTDEYKSALDTLRTIVLEGFLRTEVSIDPKNYKVSDANTTYGSYYIIGMVKDARPGSVYIDFGNSSPFTAVVDFAASKIDNEYSGGLSITTDAQLDDLAFSLVYGTSGKSPNESEHVYVGVNASSWGDVLTLSMHVSGVNFIPINDTEFKAPSGAVHRIAICRATTGFSASQVNIQVGNIGEVVAWSKFNENGVPEGIPANCHICDGKPIDATDWPDLVELGLTNFPLVDYHIIVGKKTSA